MVLFTAMGFAFLANAQHVATNQLKKTGLQRIDVSGNYVDYIIPKGGYKALFLEVKGADGGRIPGKAGGSGATVKGWVRLGNAGNEIPAGSTIRFIVGEVGKTDEKKERHGSGGGGTAIAFRKPNDKKDSWNLLMVAGGGGGAASGYYGGEAEITENGTSGKGRSGKNLNNAGVNGYGGGSKSSFGGGGAFSAGVAIKDCYRGTTNSHTCDSGGSAGFDANNEPTGGAGGSGSDMVTGGFGGGGAAFSNRVKNGFIYTSGGGGGGYSGGGGGSYGANGGGGGSYVNTKWISFSEKKRNGTTFTPLDGYINYELANETPWTSIHLGDGQGKCLDANKQNTVFIAQCSSNSGQVWIFDPPYIRSAMDGNKCLDLKGNNTSNGTGIQLYDCSESNTQQWVYDGVSKQIRYRANWNKCLDSKAGNIRIWDCLNVPSQQWEIPTAVGNTPITIGGNTRVKNIYLAKDATKCLDLFDSNTDDKNNIRLSDCKKNDKAQQWLFDGTFIRYYAYQKKCVDIEGRKTRNGTNIQIYDCNDPGAQQWVYDGITGTIRYRKDLDKCLVAKGGRTAKGTNIEIMDCDGGMNQRWGLRDASISFDPDKIKTIRRSADDGKCLDVEGGRTTNATDVRLWSCIRGEINQQWIYDGVYFRFRKDPKMCLDLRYGKTSNQTNIQLFTCHGGKNQRWFYDHETQTIRTALHWEKCVSHNNNKDDADIWIYDCTKNNKAQQWVIK